MSTEDVGMTAFHQLVNSSFLNPTRYRYRLMTCSSAVNASVILRRNMYPLSLHPNFIYASSTVYHTCYRNRLMTCSTSINAPIISWRNMSPLSLHTNFIYASLHIYNRLLELGINIHIHWGGCYWNWMVYMFRWSYIYIFCSVYVLLIASSGWSYH